VWRARPSSVADTFITASPWIVSIEVRRTHIDRPKALPVRFWQSVQWQA
jgi:hypothetical protein